MLRFIPFIFLLTSSDFTQSVRKAMPTWEADKLAQYEQAELAVVRKDLEDGVDEDQLRADWDTLAALDAKLQLEYLI